jgi:nitroreductase
VSFLLRNYPGLTKTKKEESAMTAEEAITVRRSIRKFKKDEIHRGLLEEILETASWAPSWGNTQP